MPVSVILFIITQNLIVKNNAFQIMKLCKKNKKIPSYNTILKVFENTSKVILII